MCLRLVFVHTRFLEGPTLLSLIDLFGGRTTFFSLFVPEPIAYVVSLRLTYVSLHLKPFRLFKSLISLIFQPFQS